MISDPALAQHWLASIARAPIRAALESIYAAAAAEISARAPACWASGRCCNFERTGHLLYTTGFETAYTIALLPEIAATRPENFAAPTLSRSALNDALHRGGCPFQLANLCGVHAIKPLGCRLYFCDRSAQQWQHDLSERLLADIRAIHDQHAIDYRYGEWRQMLAHFAAP